MTFLSVNYNIIMQKFELSWGHFYFQCEEFRLGPTGITDNLHKKDVSDLVKPDRIIK